MEEDYFPSSVYDRRRQHVPDRTPPPLRKRRPWGCLPGYGGRWPSCLEWYRLRLADYSYRQQSIEEYREVLEKQDQMMRKEASPVMDEILRKAEQICYEQSPYFDRQHHHQQLDDVDQREEKSEIDRVPNSATPSTTTSSSSSGTATSWASADLPQSEEELSREPNSPQHQLAVQPFRSRAASLEDHVKPKGDLVNNDGQRENSKRDDASKSSWTKPTWTSAESTTKGLDSTITITRLSNVPATMQVPPPQQSGQDDAFMTKIQPDSTPADEGVSRLRFFSRPLGILRSQDDMQIHGDPVAERNSRRVHFLGGVGNKALPYPKPDQGGNSEHRRDPRLNFSMNHEIAERLAKLRISRRNIISPKSTYQILSALVTCCRRGRRRTANRRTSHRRGSSQVVSEFSEDQSATGGRLSDAPGKVSKHPLNEEEQELLRYIGLDSFLTLRFLRFGFDVAFVPFLLSLGTLVPLYKLGGRKFQGFYSFTVLMLNDGDAGYLLVMVFGAFQFAYILRRLWMEWEIFIALRYDFLEHGDFQKEKYKEQYLLTCVVDYLPKTFKTDKELYAFFDAIFPGQVRRTEILLNTEYLSALNRERLKNIKLYEDVYAKKVHQRAIYIRQIENLEEAQGLRFFCGSVPTREPQEPTCIVVHLVPRHDSGNNFTNNPGSMVKDPRTYPALRWYHYMIGRLNKEIEDECLRIARSQRRPRTHQQESPLAKWIGLKYLTGSDTRGFHSRTAFVEFRTLEAKQAAVRCNITGSSNLLVVGTVPEIRDIIWDNAHVSRALIETRKAWVNLLLAGGLMGWPFLVSFIRSYDDVSSRTGWKIAEIPAARVFIDTYLPVLILEGLLRVIPTVIRAFCIWIRCKSKSERDHYILKWHFGYRVLTFIFVIVGESLIHSSDNIVRDPIHFFKECSDNVAENSQFIMCYVIVTLSLHIFFPLSQMRCFIQGMLLHRSKTKEAMSQRRLEKALRSTTMFHLEAFIPIFVFIFMIGTIYGAVAPLSGLIVASFFHLAFKVFKFMTLFVYVNQYESGGVLFYSVSRMIFFCIYLIILTLAAHLSLHGSPVNAVFLCLMLFVTVYVQRRIYKTFVVPSRTLALSKAREADAHRDLRPLRERKLDEYLRTKKELEALDESERSRISDKVSAWHNRIVDGSWDSADNEGRGSSRSIGSSSSSSDAEKRKRAMSRLARRYVEDEAAGEITGSDDGSAVDFFIYRQPVLNRATWESAPRPYRDHICRDSCHQPTELWG